MINMVCGVCGLVVGLDGGPIESAADFIAAAHAAEFKVLKDGQRLACVCSDDCAEKAVTKSGRLRKRIGGR